MSAFRFELEERNGSPFQRFSRRRPVEVWLRLRHEDDSFIPPLQEIIELDPLQFRESAWPPNVAEAVFDIIRPAAERLLVRVGWDRDLGDAEWQGGYDTTLADVVRSAVVHLNDQLDSMVVA